MLIVFPICLKERAQAVRLFSWIEELGAGRQHDALLVMSADAEGAGLHEELRGTMERSFRTVTFYRIPIEAGEGWRPDVNGNATTPNNMFIWGSGYADFTLRRPFLWFEMDAVPTRATAFDEIEAEYKECGKPFMGDLVKHQPFPPHMSGVAVYPRDIAHHSQSLRNLGAMAWDIASKDEVLPKMHVTTLIQHKHLQGRPCDAVTEWNGKAAIFHQEKCTCLYDRLRGVDKSGQVAAALICAENAGSNPATATPVEIEIERMLSEMTELQSRVLRLESLLASRQPGVAASAPAKSAGQGVIACPPSLKPPRRRRGKPVKVRPPQEQAEIDARMARVRAAKRQPAIA